MTDETQTETPPSGEEQPLNELAEELRALGQNLQAALKAAWECEEHKKVKTDIQNGLKDLTQTLNQAAKDFGETPTGQTLKADIEDFKQRMNRDEVRKKVRSDVASALHTVNAELQKAAQRNKEM